MKNADPRKRKQPIKQEDGKKDLVKIVSGDFINGRVYQGSDVFIPRKEFNSF